MATKEEDARENRINRHWNFLLWGGGIFLTLITSMMLSTTNKMTDIAEKVGTLAGTMQANVTITTQLRNDINNGRVQQKEKDKEQDKRLDKLEKDK